MAQRMSVGYGHPMTKRSAYLDKFGSFADHNFDRCPISGRCSICGVRGDFHPVNIKPVGPRR